MIFNENAPALRGQLELHIKKNGQDAEYWTDHNAIMPDAYNVLANLLCGISGYSASYVGVFSGNSESPNAESLSAMRTNCVPVVGTVLTDSPNKVQFTFLFDANTCNGVAIQEFGLLCGPNKILFAHRVRSSTIEKTDDMEIAGTWTITFDSPSTAV